jgi:hypothetical protein
MLILRETHYYITQEEHEASCDVIKKSDPLNIQDY